MFKQLLFKKNPWENTVLDEPDKQLLERQYADGWKNDKIPAKQRRLVDSQLERFDQIPGVRALVNIIKNIPAKNPSVLDIGCSSGYLSEIFNKSGLKIKYEGCDYSEAFIKMAKAIYPNEKFKISDATNLKYPKNSFDIVISACCLQAIVNYQKAISETARVAKKYVIFFRTPIVHIVPTVFTTKEAYVSQTIEIFFNESELIHLFNKFHLNVIGVYPYGMSKLPGIDDPTFMKTYLCMKT